MIKSSGTLRRLTACLLALAMAFCMAHAGASADGLSITPYTPSVLGDAYEIDGNVVTVNYEKACKLGYLSSGAYVSVPCIPQQDGSYVFTVPEGVYELILVIAGDVNLNGDISNADATKLKAAMKGTTTLTPEQAFAADANEDGKLSNADATKTKASLKGTAEIEWDLVKASYRVEYYKQTASGSLVFLLDSALTKNLEAGIGKEVTANVISINGYVYDEDNADNVPSGTVLEDGSLVLSLCYKVDADLNGIADDEENPAVERPDHWERLDDDEVYTQALGEFEDLMYDADYPDDPDERFVLMAKAEASLLDAAVILPFTTQGGNYALTRMAYHCLPQVSWGNDADRLKGAVISSDIITKEEREDLKTLWNSAMGGYVVYDPAAYLTSRGHGLENVYKAAFSTGLRTLDILTTYRSSDLSVLVNCFDGLVEYDNMGQLQPALAYSWEVTDGGTVYTFHIRPGANWYYCDGSYYAEITADDFVASMQHVLDSQSGFADFIGEYISGAQDYMYGGCSFDDVGCKALDDYTVQYTLSHSASFFMSVLSYPCFTPLCRSFYEMQGGLFGADFYGEPGSYGTADDIYSCVYNGAFLPTLVSEEQIYLTRNDGYYNPDSVKIDAIDFFYNDGSDPTFVYNAVMDGRCTAAGLNAASVELAKEEGVFDIYAYVSDTTATTYYGGLNLNRGTFELEEGACASSKDEDEKIDYQLAVLNKNFRKAILHSVCKADYNAFSVGEDLKYVRLRNMYTPPEFVYLSSDKTDADGHSFAQGTSYGDMVQYYLSSLDPYIDVNDGVDGWYDPEAAQNYLALAEAELGSAVNWPIIIDVVYYSGSSSQYNQLCAIKNSIEESLGTDKVVINPVAAEDLMSFYYSGYFIDSGSELNMDFYYGTGWGPDYGDPLTYLRTMRRRGDMTASIGLF